MIRPATEKDAEALLAIYAPYVRNTAVSFEYDVPTVAEFSARIRNTISRYPYLVAEEGEILGYCYASPFHGRAAYGWAAEASIYLRQDARGRGIGRALYGEMERLLAKMGVRSLLACIAWTDREDPHLSGDSAAFHGKMGFAECAHFHRVGYKFGKWYDVIWMEKFLKGDDAVAPVKPYPDILQTEERQA